MDNPGTPVTETGDSSAESPGTPVTDARTPVTGDGTPVTDARNTGHGDRPPNQAPTSTTPNQPSPNQQDRPIPTHLPQLEGTGPLLVAEHEKKDLDSDNGEAQYKTATAILARLDDFGSELMRQAEADMPDASTRERIVHAARLATKGIPA